MNLFQKQQTTTSGYTSIPEARAADDDETMAVPFGTKTRTMTTDRRRSSKWLAFQFAGALLLLVVGGGTVGMLETNDVDGTATSAVPDVVPTPQQRTVPGRTRTRTRGTTTTTKNPDLQLSGPGVTEHESVVKAKASPKREKYTDDDICFPAGGTFGGVSRIVSWGGVTMTPFETCYQYGSYDKYCWTKSYLDTSWFDDTFKQCVPDPRGGQWRAIEQKNMKYVNPVTHPYSCGEPCQGQHEK